MADCNQIPAGPARDKCFELQRAQSQSTGGASYSTNTSAAPPGSYTVPGNRPVNPTGVYWPRTWDQINVNTSTLQGVSNASNPNSPSYNFLVERNQVPAFRSLTAAEQAMFNAAAQSIHPMKLGSTLYEELVASSLDMSGMGIYRSPQALAYDILNGGGGSNSSGGGGGGFGSVAPQPADASAVRRAMDTLARGTLGRTLSNREFRDYYKQYVSEFGKNPDIDMQQHGIEALQGNDDYQEFQVATKFADAMKSVIQGIAT